MPATLEGVKVLDFMWVIAGPTATRYLADFGATVVRVESSKRIETGRTIGPFHDGVPGPESSGCRPTIAYPAARKDARSRGQASARAKGRHSVPPMETRMALR